MFIVGKVLAALVLPPGLFVVTWIVGIFLFVKAMKKAAMLVTIANVVVIYFLSTVATSSLLLAPLENSFPPLKSPVVACAIVVLGGGYVESSPEYGNEGALSRDSVKRAVYGLELSRKYNLPLIFSGGRAFDSSQPGSEAEAAGRLWRSLGTSPDYMTLETESKDTKGNAINVARLAGDGPFILVTTAVHIPRAMSSFQKAGLSVIAAPTDYRSKRTPLTWSDFLPNSSSLQDSCLALHEYLGILYYRLS